MNKYSIHAFRRNCAVESIYPQHKQESLRKRLDGSLCKILSLLVANVVTILISIDDDHISADIESHKGLKESLMGLRLRQENLR